MTLKPEDLYSVAPVWPNFKGSGQELAKSIAKGNFSDSYGKPEFFQVEQFNLANMRNPVPASAYYAAMDDCFVERSSNCATIIDDTYNPWLALKQHVLASIEPSWSTCKQGIRGILDPPVALRPIFEQPIETPSDNVYLDPMAPAIPAKTAPAPWPEQTKHLGKEYPPMPDVLAAMSAEDGYISKDAGRPEKDTERSGQGPRMPGQDTGRPGQDAGRSGKDVRRPAHDMGPLGKDNRLPKDLGTASKERLPRSSQALEKEDLGSGKTSTGPTDGSYPNNRKGSSRSNGFSVQCNLQLIGGLLLIFHLYVSLDALAFLH
jgi:hypothetical protein